MSKKQNETVDEQIITEKVAENNTVDTTASEEKKADENNLDNIDVPADAEEIPNDEALKLAADEVNRLREENIKIIAELDEANAKLQATEDVIKQFEENKNFDCKKADNSFFIELLNCFEAKIDEYAGLRRERLRKEFITDLKEEIERQRKILTNA